MCSSYNDSKFQINGEGNGTDIRSKRAYGAIVPRDVGAEKINKMLHGHATDVATAVNQA